MTGKGRPGWDEVRELVATEQARLVSLVEAIGEGRVKSPLGDDERFEIVLGITCHAVYHAGQVQLVKKLVGK